MSGGSHPIPEAGNLSEFLKACCTRYAEHPAVSDARTSLSYAELDQAVDGAAAELTRAPVAGPVVVLMDNSVGAVVRLFACWRAGRCAIPLDASVPAAVIEKALTRSGSRLLSSCDSAVEVRVVAMEAAEREGEPDPLLEAAALTIFTSGSTGIPKGVVLGHEGILAKLRMVQEVLDYRPGDRALAVLRSSFLFCQWDVLLALGTGGAVRLVERFDPEGLCALLTRERFDRMAVVPTMLRRLLPVLERTQVRTALAASSWPSRIIVGGELLAPHTGRRYRSLLPHSGIAVIYGLTETSAPDFILPSHEYDDHAETVGRALSGVRWRLAGEDSADRAAVPGDVGVLEVGSAGVLRGYLGQPDLTRSVVRDGYFRTGDEVQVRSDGRIAVRGRGSAVVVKGANKIAPAEVEAVLEQHPAVTTAFVCGLPDPVLGERLFAAVALGAAAAGSDRDHEETLRRWIELQVERYKVPDLLVVRPSLPVGSTGKLDRAELTAWARSGAGPTP